MSLVKKCMKILETVVDDVSSRVSPKFYHSMYYRRASRNVVSGLQCYVVTN